MAGQERTHPRASQEVERGQRPLAVGGRPPRHDPGTPGVGVVCDQCIACDDRAALRQVKRDVAQGVTRREQPRQGAAVPAPSASDVR